MMITLVTIAAVKIIGAVLVGALLLIPGQRHACSLSEWAVLFCFHPYWLPLPAWLEPFCQWNLNCRYRLAPQLLLSLLRFS